MVFSAGLKSEISILKSPDLPLATFHLPLSLTRLLRWRKTGERPVWPRIPPHFRECTYRRATVYEIAVAGSTSQTWGTAES